MKVEVKSTANPCEAEILVDGKPITNHTTGITLDLQADSFPMVTVNLGFVEVAASVEVGSISYVLTTIEGGREFKRKVRRVEFEDGTVWQAP